MVGRIGRRALARRDYSELGAGSHALRFAVQGAGVMQPDGRMMPDAAWTPNTLAMISSTWRACRSPPTCC
jgi:hypothetical protein